jgi:predicted amidohydrolase YtcJ
VDGAVPADAQVIDLRGRLAVPGFIDNHVHFIDGGFQLSRAQLRDATSPDEFVRRIAAHVGTLREGQWLLGGGWDEQRWSPRGMPSRQLIDDATGATPALLHRLDMHVAVANSTALQLAGITRGTPDPDGGTIVRDANGEPTGLLKDAAMTLVTRIIPAPSIEERMNAGRAALREAARFGVTSFCDMGMSPAAYDDFRAYQRLECNGELTARVSLFMPIGTYERLRDAGVEKHFGGDRLRIGGLKGFADGSLGSSTAAFFEPFTDEPHHCGLVMAEMSNGSIAQWIADADAHELQIAIHAIGDRANADVLSIFEERGDARVRRFRIEHAQHLDPALIERFARSGVIASMQPAHAIDDGRWAETRIGRERVKYAYAFRALLDAGAMVTFGSDWSVAPLDPILGIHAAVTRRTIDGRNPDGWIPEQKITVEEALRCYTIHNAHAMFAEKEIGRIAPGMLADVAILSDDLFAIAPEQIERVRVDMTIFGGEIIYSERS